MSPPWTPNRRTERRQCVVGQRQVVPVAVVDDHVASGPQIAPDDVHQTDLAAMGVEQQQFAHASRCDTVTDLGPDTNQGFRAQRQRAGKTRVLIAFADSLGRQYQHWQICSQLRQSGTYDRIHQITVDRQREMRSVLLGGTHRQNGNDPTDVRRTMQRKKVTRRQVGPVAGW
jgi:hypothetical protein